MSSKIYDLCIVGSGPAGMMTAIKLVDNGYKNIAIIEKGKHRSNNPNENITEGIGGCGSFSDSKVCLTHKVGGTNYELCGLKRFYEYIKEQDDIWLRFAPTKNQIEENHLTENVNDRLFVPNEGAEDLRAKALANDMDLLIYPVRHLGTTNVFYICDNIFKFLAENGVDIFPETEVISVEKNNFLFESECLRQNKSLKIKSKNILLAPGRAGSKIFKKVMSNFKISLLNGTIDIGLRVEAPSEIGKFLLDENINLYEPKFIYYSKLTKTKVRSFCYSGDGACALEEYRDTGIKTVNGHSLGDGKKTGNLNFAVLSSETFTEPFHNSQEYAESICKLANLLAGGDVLVQRLGDLKAGRRSTPQRIREGATIPTLDATPGDVSLCIPQRQLTAIIEFLEVMDKVMPGISGSNSLLYAMEVKYYSNKVKVDSNSMTEVIGLYVAGDGASLSRGLNQASVNGLIVADALLNNQLK